MKVTVQALTAVAALLSSCSDNDASVSDASNKTATTEGAASNAVGSATAGNSATDTPAQIVARAFQSADLNESGMLTRPEVTVYMDLVRLSQDADEDGRLSLGEFEIWDVGFSALAAENGVAAKYSARKQAIFETWDTNGDGYVTQSEVESIAGQDFAATPRSQERRMSPDEFAQLPFIRYLAAASVQ